MSKQRLVLIVSPAPRSCGPAACISGASWQCCVDARGLRMSAAGVLDAAGQCWGSAALTWQASAYCRASSAEMLRHTQRQGCFVLAGVSAGWFWAADRRSKALAAARAASAERTPARERPHVTAVLPVRGCTPNKLRNWASQTRSDYGGRLDVLFVAESAEDPAVRHRAGSRHRRRG